MGKIEGKWREEEGKKHPKPNKSSCEVDSIARLAKQAKESQKFQVQNSEAIAVFQRGNTLHLISAMPTDTIYRKSITS